MDIEYLLNLRRDVQVRQNCGRDTASSWRNGTADDADKWTRMKL